MTGTFRIRSARSAWSSASPVGPECVRSPATNRYRTRFRPSERRGSSSGKRASSRSGRVRHRALAGDPLRGKRLLDAGCVFSHHRDDIHGNDDQDGSDRRLRLRPRRLKDGQLDAVGDRIGLGLLGKFFQTGGESCGIAVGLQVGRQQLQRQFVREGLQPVVFGKPRLAIPGGQGDRLGDQEHQALFAQNERNGQPGPVKCGECRRRCTDAAPPTVKRTSQSRFVRNVSPVSARCARHASMMRSICSAVSWAMWRPDRKVHALRSDPPTAKSRMPEDGLARGAALLKIVALAVRLCRKTGRMR